MATYSHKFIYSLAEISSVFINVQLFVLFKHSTLYFPIVAYLFTKSQMISYLLTTISSLFTNCQLFLFKKSADCLQTLIAYHLD